MYFLIPSLIGIHYTFQSDLLKIHHPKASNIKIKYFILFTHLWHKNEQHTQKTTKNHGQRNKRKRSVLLRCYHHRYRCCDEAEHGYIVNTHTNIARVVDLFHLN